MVKFEDISRDMTLVCQSGFLTDFTEGHSYMVIKRKEDFGKTYIQVRDDTGTYHQLSEEFIEKNFKVYDRVTTDIASNYGLKQPFVDDILSGHKIVGNIEVKEPVLNLDHLEKEYSDNVAEQEWYTSQGIEPIKYMKANFTKDEYRGFLHGNIQKYVTRHKEKNGIKDLEKAKVYLEWLIEDWEER